MTSLRRSVLGSIGTIVIASALSAGCSAAQGSAESENSSQSTQTITVRIKDPIPTFRDDALQISVGEGRDILVDVLPAKDIEYVEMHAQVPDQIFARVAHAPFKLYLPADAPGVDGHRW